MDIMEHEVTIDGYRVISSASHTLKLEVRADEDASDCLAAAEAEVAHLGDVRSVYWTDEDDRSTVTVEVIVAHGIITSPLPHTAGFEPATWWAALAYSPDGHVNHPICPWDDLDSYDPQSIADEACLKYGLRARRAALELAEELDRAIAAAAEDDIDSVIDALCKAHHIERPYHATPATDAATAAILGEGWTLNHRREKLTASAPKAST